MENDRSDSRGEVVATRASWHSGPFPTRIVNRLLSYVDGVRVKVERRCWHAQGDPVWRQRWVEHRCSNFPGGCQLASVNGSAPR